jgi:hypothetical protein
VPLRGPPKLDTLGVMGAITLYREPNGDWSLHADSGGELVRAELAAGYVAVQGLAGAPRILSTKPNELGMTILQAVERGILRLEREQSSEFERVTLARLKAALRRSPK